MPTSVPELAARLEETFSMIERERMADVPILNTSLNVEAVGFREWEGQCLGVLITPWFMNLMLLPLDADEAESEQRSGETSSVHFPAAEFEFIFGEEPDIGGYRMCSLFSPVFDFEDHAAAVATAESVLEQLMTAPDDEEENNEPKPQTEPVSRRDLFRGLADRDEAHSA